MFESLLAARLHTAGSRPRGGEPISETQQRRDIVTWKSVPLGTAIVSKHSGVERVNAFNIQLSQRVHQQGRTLKVVGGFGQEGIGTHNAFHSGRLCSA